MLWPLLGSWVSRPFITVLQAHWPPFCSSETPSLFPHLCFCRVQHPNSGILVMALFFIQPRMRPSLTTQQQGAFPRSTFSHHCWFILSLNTIWNYLIHFFVCFYGQEMGPSYSSLTLQLLCATPFPIPRSFLSLVFYHSPANRLCFGVDLI